MFRSFLWSEVLCPSQVSAGDETLRASYMLSMCSPVQGHYIFNGSTVTLEFIKMTGVEKSFEHLL